MTPEGNDAEEFMKNLFSKQRKEEHKALQKSKEMASLEGKEPFDIEKVLEYFPLDHSEEKAYNNNPELLKLKTKSYEKKYYLTYPEIRTLKEFGEKLNHLNNWGAFD